MPTMQEVRAKFPQYNDMSDEQLAGALHGKFYSDMPREEFNAKVGFDPAKSAAMSKRDEYYSSGIYAGEWNPLGPIMKSLDAGAQGLGRAPMMGWDDEALAAVSTGGGMLGDYEAARKGYEAQKNAIRAQNPVASMGGEIVGTALTAAGAAPAAGAAMVAGPSLAGRAIAAGQSLPRVAAASTVDGAVLGAVQGAGDAQPGSRVENAGYGAIGGGALGMAAPVAVAGVSAATRRGLSPFLTSEERRLAADYLEGEGVHLTAGQRTGSNRLRYSESELGGGRAQDLIENQGEEYTAAALRRAGVDARRATPEVMDDAFTRIGNDFDGLAARNNLLPDQQLEMDLISTAREYVSMVPPSQRAPVVQDTIMDIANALGQGPLDGAAYQAMRSRLDRAARGSRNDPQLQQALHGIRNNLDDAMERNISMNNPADIGRWREVRNQYRNMLVLERAGTGAGENAANGIISPQALRQATVSGQGRRNYARGNGDFAELARSGVATMQPMPNSGTAGRLKAQALGTGVTSLLGAGGAGYASGGDPMTMLGGAAAGFAAPRMAGAMLMSRPMQTYLGNQVGRNVDPNNPMYRAILNRLLGIEGAESAPSLGRMIVGQ